MAKHAESRKPNKNLLMHIRKNPGNSVKESGKYKEANTMPGYTDDSQHCLKYHVFIAQCENLEQRFADFRNDQTEIVKKLDILESRRRTVLVSCKSRHNKQITAFEETQSASCTLDHTSNKRDSGFAERLQMLRRTHTSLVDDNRITNLKNTENTIVSNAQGFVYFSNVEHFRTIQSASQQLGNCVAFQDVSMRATSEYDKSLVIQSALPKRKLQMRQLRRFNTDTKEDNRIVSYEAQIEHVRDKISSQNRTQAKELRRQDDRFTTELHENKTETKTEMSSTEKPVTRLQADKSEILMPKSNTMAAEYSKKGVSFEESAASTDSMLGAVQSQLKSRLKGAFGDQLDESLVQFNTMHFDEMKNMMKQDGTMGLMPALRTQLPTMRTDHPELSEHIDISEALVSSGNDLPFLNMSTLMRSQELESAYLAEYQEGRKYRVSGHSVETIICLDTSESMKGPLWTKAITFAKNFILEVKYHPCRDPSVFERIGLVTFGHVTCVQAHLTRHYDDVLSKLDTLSPSGPRPLMPGLKMCEIAIKSAGRGGLQMNKMRIFPRIILITDGKTTSHSYQEGSDFSFTQDLDEALVMHSVQEIVKVCPLHIDCVPLGESKIDFLTKISQSTNGKIYKCEEWKKLGRRTKFLFVASRHYKDFLKKGDIDFIRSIIRTLWSVKGEDLDIVEESMRRSKAKEPSEEDQLSEERINKLEDQLLPIGTRVRRGPDWKWGDQDSQGAGTIVGYNKNNWVSVVWDNYDSSGGNSNQYRYAFGGNFDVMPVEEPRVLSPGEIIAVGCKVRRGRDWIYGDQDGGSDNVGTVIKKGERSDKVTVRWPNRKSYKYKFGKKGKCEIQLCDTHESYTPSIITEKESDTHESYTPSIITEKESDTHESYTSSIMTEKERESVVGKHLKDIEHQKVKQKRKEIDVEEMNKRNIEMSKGYINPLESSFIES
ncbi:hypothetical protein CHS0354_037939 [Potamilus streckersoni]|uniref:MIB/HERC2 domain-containing protein n=1 Tax=Potamilus streckersoni TaxID=2493646 RepID=A0AAE0TAM8_9BIVA|nr:hypothetical protein CHS0354_037939 [Potamilus streckersoni]